MKGLILLVVIIGAIIWYEPFDSCREYSYYNCEQIQNAEYNVYFYFADQSEKHLGQVKGLDECGRIASDFADKTNVTSWDYICCMKTEDSDCYEKHR